MKLRFMYRVSMICLLACVTTGCGLICDSQTHRFEGGFAPFHPDTGYRSTDCCDGVNRLPLAYADEVSVEVDRDAMLLRFTYMMGVTRVVETWQMSGELVVRPPEHCEQ